MGTKILDEARKLKTKIHKIKTKNLPEKSFDESNLPKHEYWGMKHFTFIEAYRETLDEKEAAKIAGISDGRELRDVLNLPKIKEAMEDARKDFVEALKMTPKKGARKFIEVYQKIESRFDEGDSKVAAALANMASTFLKATGQLDKAEKSVGSKISIHIDLGLNEEKKIIKNITND